MLQISPVMKLSPKNEHAKVASAGDGDGNRGQADRTKATYIASHVALVRSALTPVPVTGTGTGNFCVLIFR